METLLSSALSVYTHAHTHTHTHTHTDTHTHTHTHRHPHTAPHSHSDTHTHTHTHRHSHMHTHTRLLHTDYVSRTFQRPVQDSLTEQHCLCLALIEGIWFVSPGHFFFLFFFLSFFSGRGRAGVNVSV